MVSLYIGNTAKMYSSMLKVLKLGFNLNVDD